jgi:hypothetical protein
MTTVPDPLSPGVPDPPAGTPGRAAQAEEHTMTYNVEAARAERAAQRSTEPFQFEFRGRQWTMKDRDDLPAVAATWTEAGFVMRFDQIIVEDDWPTDAIYSDDLTVGDLTGLVQAWLGATPGE